ncbi:hypothetical protein PR048_013223 [Dryococelus australis]|uniref:Uncharacterized protein n=1 Tax=Dryococelus australis TaxID=614101 RepID=A0ABQ9HRK8_9NEOP|nr:hypothetical protein PR048_013223 [Dryococelus australis]
MQLLHEKNGVLYVLTDSPPKEVAAFQHFKNDYVKAQNTMVNQSIPDSFLTMIMGKNTTNDIIETLCATYKNKYQCNQPLQEFFQKFKEACGNMTTARGKMDEGEIVNQLLFAMPHNFENVVSTLDIMFSKDKSAVKVDYVKNSLLAKEERHREISLL